MRVRSPLVLVLIAALVGAVGVATWQTWRTTPTAGAPGQEGWVSTQWGPLGPADRDLLIRVRLAGLWEHPVGQEMADRGTQPRVREIGDLISSEHQELDRMVIDVSRQLGVLLPNQPTTEQQAWMTETTAASGANYDWMAVNLLRQAHGAILPQLATVRVGTRNDLVRQFAADAYEFVNRHCGYLESTGLVDFARLDEPPAPPRAVVTPAGQYENVPVALIAMAVIALCGVLAAVLVRLLRERRRSRPTRAQRSDEGSPP